jgi:G3E family GTPase
LDHKRLEDRIHALLAKAVDTTDPEKLESVVTDLRLALNEHIKRLRGMAASRPGSPRRRETD